MFVPNVRITLRTSKEGKENELYNMLLNMGGYELMIDSVYEATHDIINILKKENQILLYILHPKYLKQWPRYYEETEKIILVFLF
jgi:hypothetical protein